jgi:hypothetical protein
MTKASSLITMHAAFSSVNLGSDVTPSVEKKAFDRPRSRTGRFTNNFPGPRVGHVDSL